MKLYKKIDIYVAINGFWKYVCSTEQSKTLKAAKARYFAVTQGIHIDNIKCYFSN